MLRYAVGQPPELLNALDAAAAFHDLGKLDIDNQSARLDLTACKSLYQAMKRMPAVADALCND
jgi:hypothetical protein